MVDDIVPQGGRVIIAGQIMSTGHGEIRVAHGYANVDIDNDSGYDLIVNRIDTTKNRTGKITIIDTDRLQKNEYTFSAGSVVENVYYGELTTNVSGDGEDGYFSVVDYGDPTAVEFNGFYEPQAGIHYLWTEGQEKTKTTYFLYVQKSFNLIGGGTGFEDWLSADSELVDTDIFFTDFAPLLESEVMALESGANEDNGQVATPDDVAGNDYTILYQLMKDNDVDLLQGNTTVWHVIEEQGYRFVGTNREGVLPIENYGGADWELDATVNADNATYKSDFENFTRLPDPPRQWQEGGGWLQEKRFYTEFTEIGGLKDYYTHTLRADKPIAISFAANAGAAKIDISSDGDLLIQGDISVAEGGQVTLESTLGSVLGGETNAIFNDAPEVDAHGSVRLLVEGGEGTLEVTAGGDIWVTGISDVGDPDTSLTVGTIESKAGDVTVIAADGILAADATTSFVKGNRVELSAENGDIDGGGSAALRIDSNILGSGGLSAKAGGDISLTETEGNLKLILAQDFKAVASVEGGGAVTLRTVNGSILDATYELDVLADLENTPLTPEQQLIKDRLNGDAPLRFEQVQSSAAPLDVSGTLVLDVIDGKFSDGQQVIYSFDTTSGKPLGGLTAGGKYFAIVRDDGHVQLAATAQDAADGIAIALTLDTNASKIDGDGVTGSGHKLSASVAIFDTDDSNDITDDAFRFPVSPGLYKFLYPHSELNDVRFSIQSSATETMNVVGDTVTLIADKTGATAVNVGRSFAPQVIDLTVGFENLSSQQKEVLATATVGDVIGVQYAFYTYDAGGGAAGSNLKLEDFGDSEKWTLITPDVVSGAGVPQPLRTINPGDLVLIEFSQSKHGLYEFKGASPASIRLDLTNLGNAALWDKIDPARSTDGTNTSPLVHGDIVANKNEVQRVALQLKDDVDVQLTGDTLKVDSDGDVSMQIVGDVSIHHVTAAGDVRLDVSGSISDAYAPGTAAAITALGDVVLTAHGGPIQSPDGKDAGTDPDAVRIRVDGALFAESPNDIRLLEVGGTATVSGISANFDDLHVAGVTAGESVDIRVAAGDMTIDRIDAGDDSVLIANQDIIDADNDSGSPLVNVSTGDDLDPAHLYIEATEGSIGTLSNHLDVVVTGTLNGKAGASAFINSPIDLNVGLFQARNGTARLVSNTSILDADNDVAADIEAQNVELVADSGAIGSDANALDIDSSYFTTGYVNAEAEQKVHLIETLGALQVRFITSRTDDVTLETLSGAIVDEQTDAANNVSGVNINLIARGGSIGTASDALEIDSSNPQQGWLNADASSSLNVAETDGTLNVGTVIARAGDARLSVRDSSDSDEHLVMDANASVQATGLVLMRVGDNVMLQQGSLVSSLEHITIHGDTDDLGNNADAAPTSILIEGSLASNEIEIAGERQGDTITLRPEHVSGHVAILGDTDGLAGGDDLIIVDHMTTLQTARNRLDDGVSALVRDTRRPRRARRHRHLHRLHARQRGSRRSTTTSSTCSIPARKTTASTR